jgi:dTDP-4-amino-4,6-dideoxygalactose transaminase
MSAPYSRRAFVVSAAAAAAARGSAQAANDRLAILGGKPVRSEPFPEWPIVTERDEQAWIETLRSGNWYRRQGRQVSDFESAWAKTVGSRHALAVNGGTSALLAALHALDVGPGDEVIVPPYTFIATVNVVLMRNALPVFVDTDRKTFQIDASKIEQAITPQTRAILPVHLGGAAADMDRILEVAAKRSVPVVEDACQAHLAEWKRRKVGSLGALGCFSFQGSKNLPSGEGGAVVSNDSELMARADSFHNNGHGLKDDLPDSFIGHGCNLRMTEFQGALLLAQMTRLEQQSRSREKNATYLSEMLAQIGGIAPAEIYPGCTRNAYHLYLFRYDPAAFAGVPRARFIEALRAEGVPVSGGYSPLNRDPFLEAALRTRPFQAIYSKRRLDNWRERNSCPQNDQLCREALWFSQTLLLGSARDMEQIAEAIARIQKNADALAKA